MSKKLAAGIVLLVALLFLFDVTLGVIAAAFASSYFGQRIFGRR